MSCDSADDRNDPRSRPHYSVRLFCASSEYYRPPNMAPPPGMPMPSNRQIPIEYPGNPDVILDGHMVPFKERGLRGKAGSAPPLDIDRSSRGLIRMPGRMASISMGHTGPTVSKKKEYSKVRSCAALSIADNRNSGSSSSTASTLVWRTCSFVWRLYHQRTPKSSWHDVSGGRHCPIELTAVRQRAADHEDIEIGPSTLSLKDPVSVPSQHLRP